MRFFSSSMFGLAISFLLAGSTVAQTTPPVPTETDPPTIRELLAREAELRALLTEPFKQYEAQLQAVNKTRFPEEKIFVLEVAVEVERKEIPKPVVDAAWLWVRKNRPTTNHPFVYFERILRLEGERLNLPIPPFDANIYSRIRPDSSRLTEIQNNIRQDR